MVVLMYDEVRTPRSSRVGLVELPITFHRETRGARGERRQGCLSQNFAVVVEMIIYAHFTSFDCRCAWFVFISTRLRFCLLVGAARAGSVMR
jgi:hypothetical protein